MSSHENSNQSWRIFAGWMLASLLGWAVGLGTGVLLTWLGGQWLGLNEDRLLLPATLACVALATGLAQSRLLAKNLPTPLWWVSATLLGYLLGVSLIRSSTLYVNQKNGLSDDVALLFLLGAGIGVVQWLVLRRFFRQAGVWAPATTLGFLCFLWLAANPAGSTIGFVVVGTLLGGLSAALPGAALAWVLRSSTD